jgi:dimeric dUTPase (all-alpha-NTP-PPase superfamily)
MDKFEEMLRLQKEFQDTFPFKLNKKKCLLAMLMELGEMAEASESKWWSKKRHTHEQRLEEAVDFWHFFMIYLIKEKITADEFFEAYKSKLVINYQRQESKTY